MPKFRFSAIINGEEYVKEIEIPNIDLRTKYYLGEQHAKQYRENVIQTRLNTWATSLFNLSWEEVKENDQDHAYRTHPSIEESKTEKATE